MSEDNLKYIWHVYRVVFVDGSSVVVNSTNEQEAEITARRVIRPSCEPISHIDLIA